MSSSFSSKPLTPSARSVAFQAIMYWEKGSGFLEDFFNSASVLSTLDQKLAQEISYGTVRRKLTLDYLAKEHLGCSKLPLKKEQRILLWISLYQAYFLDNIPLYAIVNESVKLAKHFCHPSFARFLNALLRKVNKGHLIALENLPLDAKHQAIRFSYPEYFVHLCMKQYGIEQTLRILELGNARPIAMARVRKDLSETEELDKNFACFLTPSGIKMVHLNDPHLLKLACRSPAFYIQNATPIELFLKLKEYLPNSPNNVLDLCASPGGKLLLAYDMLKPQKLYGNDVSSNRLELLKQNLDKYQINASISCSSGESFSSTELFDLIIIDAPCSNSGVLNKRPEARWRLNRETIEELTNRQFSLLNNACRLLSPKGQIWYMTCSILKEENEGIIQKACSHLSLIQKSPFFSTIPDNQNHDGGFACALALRAPDINAS